MLGESIYRYAYQLEWGQHANMNYGATLGDTVESVRAWIRLRKEQDFGSLGDLWWPIAMSPMPQLPDFYRDYTEFVPIWDARDMYLLGVVLRRIEVRVGFRRPERKPSE